MADRRAAEPAGDHGTSTRTRSTRSCAATGSVVRDEGMGGWLVLDHAGCTFVERREDLFEEPTSGLPGAAAISGRRDLRALVGEEHDGALPGHRARLATRSRSAPTRPRSSARSSQTAWPRSRVPAGWRSSASSPRACRSAIIASILGLPADDDEALRRAKGWLEAVLAWRHSYGRDVTRCGRQPSRRRASSRRRCSRSIVERGERPTERHDQLALGGRPRGLSPTGPPTTSSRTRRSSSRQGRRRRRCSSAASRASCSGRRRSAAPRSSPTDDAPALVHGGGAAPLDGRPLARPSRDPRRRARRRHDPGRRHGPSGQRGRQPRPGVLGATRRVRSRQAAARLAPRVQRRPPPLRGGPPRAAPGRRDRAALWRAFPDLALDEAADPPIFAGYVTRTWRPLHLATRHALRRRCARP